MTALLRVAVAADTNQDLDLSSIVTTGLRKDDNWKREAYEGTSGRDNLFIVSYQRTSQADLPYRVFPIHQSETSTLGTELDISMQIAELRLVEDGWLEGEGKALSDAGLNWLLGTFARHFPNDAPQPHLYPTETGDVQAEWSLGSREITLEVNLDTHSGEWHVLDLRSGQVDERIVDCDSGEDWKWLVEQIDAMNQGGP